MHRMIDFPHLGIHLERVGKTFTIGGFDIAYYGVAIALGILLGATLAFLYAHRCGEDLNDYENVLLLGIIFGIIGARAYFIIFSWKDYKGDLKAILNVREGGLAIYGGLIGAFLAVLVYTRVKKMSFLKLADKVAIGFAAGQMIGRWGNFFNREAFGEYTDSLFAMRLPIDAVRSGDVTDAMRAHIQEVDGVRMIQVHPTFLYESLWCLMILIVLLVIGWSNGSRSKAAMAAGTPDAKSSTSSEGSGTDKKSSKKTLFDGELFFIYLGLYGLGRVWIEGLRTDQLKVGPVPVSQLLSAVLIILSVCLLVIFSRRQKKQSG